MALLLMSCLSEESVTTERHATWDEAPSSIVRSQALALPMINMMAPSMDKKIKVQIDQLVVADVLEKPPADLNWTGLAAVSLRIREEINHFPMGGKRYEYLFDHGDSFTKNSAEIAVSPPRQKAPTLQLSKFFPNLPEKLGLGRTLLWLLLTHENRWAGLEVYGHNASASASAMLDGMPYLREAPGKQRKTPSRDAGRNHYRFLIPRLSLELIDEIKRQTAAMIWETNLRDFSDNSLRASA